MFIEMPDDHQPFCLFSNEEKLYILASCDAGETYSCFLYEMDTEERNTQHADITAAWKAAFGEERGSTVAAVDENGLIYLGMKGTECKILVMSEDGSQSSILRQQDVVLYDLTSVEGQIYCVGRSQGTDALFHIDSQKQEPEMAATLPDSNGTMMLRPGRGNTVLYGYYDAVYQYDLEKGEGEDIYVWTNAGIDGRSVKDFFMDKQGNVWVLPDLKEEIFIMMLLQNPVAKSEDEAVSEKETVIICGDGVRDTELAKAVGQFNTASDKYHVEIREYDYDRLAAEIMAGRGPDLIPLGTVGVSMGANKGILEDLSPYLEASDILSQDMLNERVLELYTVDGKLTCIPPSFCILTLFGKASELGSEPGWTMEQFLDYVEKHRGLTVIEGIMRGDSRMIMVMMMWYARQQQWVDWKQGEARFDDGEFEELLRFAAAYEAKYDNDPGYAEEKWTEGKLLLYSRPVLSMETFLQYRETLAGDMVAIGYPTQEGTPCNELSGYGAYGISAASAHKEGAWAFIEYLVSSQTGENTYHHGIATLNSAMEDMLEQAKEEESNEGGHAVTAVTDEDIMQFRQLLDNAVVRDGELIVVNEILTEEMEACFSGGRSVEETVDVIQSRVQLYLDENG
ncbi:MAG: extracellular solute-binding protein [Acetatifactor sp.]|nr:extracellular solute-binding protein [Acetatifactor sp.]